MVPLLLLMLYLYLHFHYFLEALHISRVPSEGRLHLGPHSLPAPAAPPLKVVGVKGLNPTGSVFVAQQLVTHVPAAPRQQQEAPQEGGGGMSMVVAAGPFTTSDNVQYEPLEELLRFCTGELFIESLRMMS